jgi:hypothetical protein
LWVTAYNNYPLDTIGQKEKWLKGGSRAWFTFYHDPFFWPARSMKRGT